MKLEIVIFIVACMVGILNYNHEELMFGKCQNWKVSEFESVRTGKCQNRKVSELESVKIGKYQNWKVK